METRKTIDIQFYHPENQTYTAAVSVPEKEELLQFINKGLNGGLDAFQFMVGITHVIKNDQYNKKTGRIKSTEALRPYLYRDFEVSFGDNGLVRIVFLGRLLGPSFALEIRENRKRVYLVEVYN